MYKINKADSDVKKSGKKDPDINERGTRETLMRSNRLEDLNIIYNRIYTIQ